MQADRPTVAALTPTHAARLDARGETLLFAWGDGVPALVYRGAALPAEPAPEQLVQSLQRPLPHATLDRSPHASLHPEEAQGHRGYPALIGMRESGQAWSGKFALDDVEESPGSIAFLLGDKKRSLSLVLECKLDELSGVAEFRSRLTNTGSNTFDVQWLACPAIQLDPGLDDMVSFSGRWCGEFARTRYQIPPGLSMQESRGGRSGHTAFPGRIFCTPVADERGGNCLGVTLGWSGNHRLFVEHLTNGDRIVQAGELLLPGEGILAPGHALETPPLYVATGHGFSDLSGKFHAHVRTRLLKLPDTAPRPVVVNTWEAIYFEHDPARLSALIAAAADIGAERFVLDDGWFLGRNDDSSSLGDWTVDPVKYPDGLGPLAHEVRAAGMTFGLWVEPEMISPNSQLFSAHPDWVLGDPAVTGRGQCVLDIAREDVAEYLFTAIANVIEASGAVFLKWDMNRDLASASGTDGRAVARAQIHALFALMARLRDRFPKLEIESCASGGGRMDFGMLAHCQRYWPSDSNDAIERIGIQSGASHFLPPEVLGAHVGPTWSHTSGRGLSMDIRTLVASWGHFGIEADLTSMSDPDRDVLRAAVDRYKADRNIWHRGRFFRIETVDPNLAAVMAVTPEQHAARLIVTQVAHPRSSIPPRLMLPGLIADRSYHIELQQVSARTLSANRDPGLPILNDGLTMPGGVLETLGLTLPCLYAETGLAIAIDAIDC